MSKLDDLLGKFDELDQKTFNYNRDYAEVCRQLSELSFVAEIDHENIYLTMLEQVYCSDSSGFKELRTLSDEEREAFYTTGRISAIGDFSIASSLHIFINSKQRYVKIFVSRGLLEKLDSPRDDYGSVFEEYNKEQLRRPTEKAEFLIDELQDDDYGKEVFGKLIKVFELSKMNTINVEKFDLKVRQNMSEHWGNLNHSVQLIDNEYQESGRPEIIKIPVAHKRWDIRSDSELLSIINGTGFDEINYEANGLIREFDTITGATAVFYSTIDYINNAQIPPKIHPTNDPQTILQVEKHYLSGKWPTPKNDQEAEELNKSLKKYIFAVTKFHDDVIVKLEVWEMGIVYIVTNVWDARSIN